MNSVSSCEKRALAVNGVKSLGFSFRKAPSLDRDDTKFRRVNAAQYFAGQAPANCVRLDNRKCSLYCHSVSPVVEEIRPKAC
jgi:hypothetical protein